MATEKNSYGHFLTALKAFKTQRELHHCLTALKVFDTGKRTPLLSYDSHEKKDTIIVLKFLNSITFLGLLKFLTLIKGSITYWRLFKVLTLKNNSVTFLCLVKFIKIATL